MAHGTHPCERRKGLGESMDRPGQVEIQGEQEYVWRFLEYGRDSLVQRSVHYAGVEADGDVDGVPSDDTESAHRLGVAW